ncbi:hypothetical protein KFL_000980120 [Klebsormidium nitens]|uniref:GDP-fucose protein O-fucosyltransferase 2 n=1 Tax=Klebsormidium nitens TaxID=105231 RepID=A0A0U9HLZ8_KLENI|nr:hypothetical protein KFL_000980120 [Klebsormidium nitens]|eukprot:GAQ82025.1 hypothetical protein KFL_000980120 [Klebsormidium nitens]
MKTLGLKRSLFNQWRNRLTYSVVATGLLLLFISNDWVNAAAWAHDAKGALKETVQTFTKSRSLLRNGKMPFLEGSNNEKFHFAPPSSLEDWDCPPIPAFSRRVGLNPEKYLLLGQINEQLTKSTRHLAEFIVLARSLNRTLVLPEVGESEIGMQRSKPFCTYFDVHRLGQFVDWVSPEQFIYDTRSRLNSGLDMSTVRKFWADARSKAVRFAFDVEWQRPETLPLGEYDWLEDGVLESDQLLGQNKPSGGVLVLKGPEDFCGLRVKPFLWFRMQQLLDSETVICINEPKFGAPGALDRSLERVVETAERYLGELDVVVGVKNRAYNLFFPKEAVKEALQYVRPAPQILKNAGRLKEWLGERYVAVQWRIEKCLMRDDCDEGVLRKCSQGLLSTVHKRLAALGATRVFFASDAPTKNGTLRSHSYMMLKDPEKKMRMASDAAAHVLSDLEAATWEMFDQTVLNIDAGIQGILDKNICMDAEAFIVAPDECIRESSAFATSIVKAREEMGKVPGMETWALAH